MPRSDSPEVRNRRDAGTSLALFICLLIGSALFALVSLVFPQVQGLIIVSLLFVVPTIFHYFVWGRWMMRVRERALAQEAQEADEKKKPPVV